MLPDIRRLDCDLIRPNFLTDRFVGRYLLEDHACHIDLHVPIGDIVPAVKGRVSIAAWLGGPEFTYADGAGAAHDPATARIPILRRPVGSMNSLFADNQWIWG